MAELRSFSSRFRFRVVSTSGAVLISFLDNTEFDGFGPSSWATAYNPRTETMPLHVCRASIRQSIREHCPAVPGVYGMVSLDRKLIYIGQSKNLRNRSLSYFTGEPASGKVRRIVEEATSLTWERTEHEGTPSLHRPSLWPEQW